jgi:hypothetical protein
MVATRNAAMLVSKRRKEEDHNNTEEPLTDASATRSASPMVATRNAAMPGAVESQEGSGVPSRLSTDTRRRGPRGNQRTSLRSDHDGPERPLTMARNGCS